MKRPVIYSALLHIFILILITVGVHNPFQRTLTQQKPLMIDFVHISDVSQAPVLAPQDRQKSDSEMTTPLENKQEVPEKPKPRLAHTPPSESQKESNPLPKPPEKKLQVEEKKEEEKLEYPQEKILEKKIEKKEVAKEKEVLKEKVEINLDKKKPKPEGEKADHKKLDDLFGDILEAAVQEDTKQKSRAHKRGSKVKGAPADRVGEVVTGTEIDAIRRQIARCWIVPNGARDVQDLIVDLEMKLAKDGTVVEAQVTDRARMARDPRFRAAADSAQRAVLDPRCNPLPLNPEKYEEWRNLEMSFNPKDMY